MAFLQALCTCHTQITLRVSLPPKTPCQALKYYSASSDINQQGVIVPHLSFIGLKKIIDAEVSSLLQIIQAKGSPCPYSSTVITVIK